MDELPSVHKRDLEVCTFSSEKLTKAENQTIIWDAVLALHQKRSIRPLKSGPMFAGYQCNESRSDKNVAFRSLIQLDIDTKTKKDKETGKITITQHAPHIDEIKPRLAQYEWFAASSHGHNPSQGIIKYRIVILPDRDILEKDHLSLLTSLDTVLGGILDRGAWQWSQAFYLPSCPQETQSDSFFYHNPGEALPVDQLVSFSKVPKSASNNTRAPSVLGKAMVGGITSTPEEPENISRLGGTLENLDPDMDRGSWRDVVWSIAAHGWACGKHMAREWSARGQKWDEDDFEKVWHSYDPFRDDTIGAASVYYRAKNAGVPQLVAASGKNLECQRDIRNAKAFACANRDRLIYVHDTGDFLEFGQTGWTKAEFGAEMQKAQAVLAAYSQDATDLMSKGELEKAKQLISHVTQSSVKQRLDAMISLANKEPGMSKGLAELDTNANLLGVSNGILNLRSGCLVPPSPSLLVTKRANVTFDMKAECPIFKDFLDCVQPSKDVRRLLQQLAGIFLSGQPEIQRFIFLYGLGANGKSTFIELLAWIMGDYAHRIQTELLIQHQRNPQGPSPDIVAFKGKRLAFCQEVGEGQKLADARVKELTGGDSLTGRSLYSKSITFEPSHNLVMVGNHKPEIHDNSCGMWRRVLLIEWKVEIPPADRDPNLLNKLKNEAPGILNWMLTGLYDFRKSRLRIPSAVQAAIDSYKDDEDLLGDWISDVCITGRTETEVISTLYNSYKSWCELRGHKPSSQTKLTRRLAERGLKRDAGKRNINGIALNPQGAFNAVG